MIEESDIVKILRAEENNRLTSNMHSIFKDQKTIEEESSVENNKIDFPEDYNTSVDDCEGRNNEQMFSNDDIADLLFESTTNMMVYLSRTGKVLKVNQATLSFSGFTKKELEGRSFWKIPGAFKKKDVPKYLKIIKDVFQGKTVEVFKGELLDKSGNKHFLNFSFYPINQNNKNIKILLVGEDITEFKQKEKQLSTSEGIYENLIESSPDAIGIIDNKGIFTHWNAAAEKIYGFSKQEIIGKHFTKAKLIHKKDIPKYIKLFLSISSGKETKPFETEILHKDGRKVLAELHYSLIKIDGKKIGIQAITRDITEKKAIETKSKESEERYRSLFEDSYDWVYVSDFKGNFLDANPVALKEMGYTKDELKNLNFANILEKGQLLKAFKETRAIKKVGKQTDFLEYKVKRKDGSIVHLETMASLLYKDGKPYAVQGIARDITNRKNYEEELKNNEEKLRTILGTVREGITFSDKTGKFEIFNDEMKRLTGYTHEEANKCSDFSKLLYPTDKDREKALDVLNKLTKPGDINETETKIITKDGKTRNMLVSTVIVRYNDKDMFLSSYRDITDRKKAEESIRDSEERYRALFESINDGVIIADVTTKQFKYVNPAICEMLGYTEEELTKMKLEDIHPDYFSNDASKGFDDHSYGSKHISESTPLIKKNGSTIYADVSATSIKIKGERFNVGIFRDTTERLKKEAELLKFSKAIQQSQTSVIITDDKANIEYINPRFEEVSGYRKAEIIGKNTNILKSGNNPKETYDELWKTISSGNIWKGELLNKKKNGETYWEHVIITPIKNTEGKITNFVASKEDITQRKKMVEDLKIKDYAISSSINAIAIANSVGNVTYVNPSFLKMWGYYNDKEIIGKPIVKFWQMKGQYMKVMDAMVNQGGWVGELTAERADGAAFPVQLSANLIKDENDEIKYMMASFVDITKQKEAEEQLLEDQKRMEEQNIKLKKLDELKSTFLNVTSHELRTPMASIKGYVQMIMKQMLGETSGEQNKALDVVLRNVERLDHLIQDILDISRLESGTMKFIAEDTNITEMIDDVAETMQSLANVKQIKIKTDIANNLPTLIVDKDRVKQIIINFINNAIKFSEQNTEIIIKANKENENILFEVQDQGRGIPADKLTKVFDTFYQVDSGMDRKFGGAGLGLAISRGIALAHGGNIWVESKVGKGSTFKFTLPIEGVKNIEDKFREIDVFRLKDDEVKEEYQKYKDRTKI